MGRAKGERYAAGGRPAGAVTPGMASIGRNAGFGVAGRAELGWAGAVAFGSSGFVPAGLGSAGLALLSGVGA